MSIVRLISGVPNLIKYRAINLGGGRVKGVLLVLLSKFA